MTSGGDTTEGGRREDHPLERLRQFERERGLEEADEMAETPDEEDEDEDEEDGTSPPNS